MVNITRGIVEVVASHGNNRLGGDDFDEMLAEYISDAVLEKNDNDTDLRTSPRTWRRLIQISAS